MSTAAIAAGLLEILQLLETAKDAAPLIKELAAKARSGATFEEVLETARNMAVTSEADAQAEINREKP